MNDDRERKIRQLAHFKWELEGRPNGQAERHWLEAAAELDETHPAYSAETLAMETAISEDQARDLVARLGSDRDLLRQAAQTLRERSAKGRRKKPIP